MLSQSYQQNTIHHLHCLFYFNLEGRPIEIDNKLETTNMGIALEQAVQHRSAIGISLTKSYKINTIQTAVVTISSLSAFFLNLANWSVADDKLGMGKPALYHFLEQVIKHLLSRAG